MAAKNKKGNSKTKTEAVNQKKYPIVTSATCVVCDTPCDRGMQYVSRVEAGKFGKGVVCKKGDLISQ